MDDETIINEPGVTEAVAEETNDLPPTTDSWLLNNEPWLPLAGWPENNNAWPLDSGENPLLSWFTED